MKTIYPPELALINPLSPDFDSAAYARVGPVVARVPPDMVPPDLPRLHRDGDGRPDGFSYPDGSFVSAGWVEVNDEPSPSSPIYEDVSDAESPS